MGEEVRANRLDASLGGTRQLANGLEVLVGTPALSEGRQRQFNRSDGSHDYRLKDMANNGEEERSSLETTLVDFFSPSAKLSGGAAHFQEATALWLTNWRPKCGGTRLNWVSGINVDCFYQ